jgi:hypothetical protein
MKSVFIVLFANFFPVCCLGVCAYMIYLNRPYWGWFLAIAAVSSVSIKSSEDDD